MLVLFDCDGTLFTGDDPLAQKAMIEALNLMTGASLAPAAMEELDARAQCARWIARELIREHSLPEIDLADWAKLVAEIYVSRVDMSDARKWALAPGTDEALARLVDGGFRIAALTGVPEVIARLRYDELGIGDRFPKGQGAFGCEVDEREDLLRLALRRARVDPAEAVEVGDTSRDVRTAKELGLQTVAVAFDDGAELPRAARRADGVARTMPELVETLFQLRAAEMPLAAASHPR